MALRDILRPKSKEEIIESLSKLSNNELKKLFLKVIEEGNDFNFNLMVEYCKENRPLFFAIEYELRTIFNRFKEI